MLGHLRGEVPADEPLTGPRGGLVICRVPPGTGRVFLRRSWGLERCCRRWRGCRLSVKNGLQRV